MECFFGLLPPPAIQYDPFPREPPLIRRIQADIRPPDAHANPLVGVATAESIQAKLDRLKQRIYET